MTKSETLQKANELEEMAKNEEIREIQIFDVTGRFMILNRYQFPKLAEKLRREAEGMTEWIWKNIIHRIVMRASDMASANARAVAEEVIATVRKGEKVNMQKIQRKHGYSRRSAVSMKAKITKTYQETMEPVVTAMIRERDAAIELLSKKRGTAKYRDLIDGTDKLTKNIQLLTGGKTSNEKVSFGWDE